MLLKKSEINKSKNLAWKGYAIFLIVYYAPIFFRWIDIAFESRAEELIGEAFSNHIVLLELARNIAGHLLLTGVFYWLVHRITKTFVAQLDCRTWLIKPLSVFWAWLLLCSINAEFFPHSLYLPPPAVSAYIVYFFSALILIASFWILLRQLHAYQFIWGTAVIIVITVAVPFIPTSTLSAFATIQKRNIVLIGVDSLSPNSFEISKDSLPNMNQFLKSSIEFKHAYTPLARTCPSWTSILTGRTPVQHGAFFNLRDIAKVDKTALVTSQLKMQGYQTIFAMDERRFCNIDESYNFDQVIGPKP